MCIYNVIFKSVLYDILARKSQAVSLRVFSEEPIAIRHNCMMINFSDIPSFEKPLETKFYKFIAK